MRAASGANLNMKGVRVVAASAAVIMLGGASGAFAADMETKAPVLKAVAADPAVCTTIMDFFTTACQVAAYGVQGNRAKEFVTEG